MSSEAMPTRAEWDSLGTKMAQAHFAVFNITLVVAGIQLFMNFYGLSIFLHTSKEGRRGRMIYVIAGFLVSIVSLLGAAVDMYTCFVNLWTKTDASGFQYLRITQINDASWSRIFTLECSVLALVLSDAILLYRCYILWRDRKWVLILPTLGLLVSLVTGVIYSSRTIIWRSEYRNILSSVFTFTLRAVNIIVTFLLAYRILLSRRSLSSAFPDQYLRRYDRVLVLLIEAAIIPAVLGIVDAVHLTLSSATFRRHEGLNFSYITFSTLYYITAVVAPQIIIFRVTVGRSFVNGTEGSEATLERSIRFAHDKSSGEDTSDGALSTTGGGADGTREAEEGEANPRSLVRRSNIMVP